MQVSIIIVSWNVRKLLEHCLTSIFTYTKNTDFEVIVVDNNSHDDTVAMVKKRFPQVKLIANDYNAGFAKANNQGLKLATGEFVYFLNPDTEFIEDSITKLLEVFDRHPDAVAATGMLVYSDKSRQPNVKGNPGLIDQLLIGIKMHHFVKTSSLRRYLAKDFRYEHEQSVEQIMGASIFIQKEVLDQLRGWDERYWLWWEDIDLCKRIQLTGKKIIYTPETRVIHHEGKSFAQKRSLEKQKRFMKGMRTYFRLHKPFWQYLLILSITPLSLLLAWLVQIQGIGPRSQSQV